jgi:valyl-tRNA synthetase
MQLVGVIQKLKQTILSIDYNIKVPVDVQVMDKEKLSNSEGEVQRLIEAMEALRSM